MRPGPKPSPEATLAFLEQALQDTLPGVDLRTAGQAVNDAIGALAKQAKALKGARYRPEKRTVKCPGCKAPVAVPTWNANAVAAAAARTAKLVDEIGRFAAFAQGLPDSRPGGDEGSILRRLTDAQLRTVAEWLAVAR